MKKPRQAEGYPTHVTEWHLFHSGGIVPSVLALRDR